MIVSGAEWDIPQSTAGDGRGRGMPKAAVTQNLLDQRALRRKETHEDVIRFAPPLVIKKEEIDWAIERIGRVLVK